MKNSLVIVESPAKAKTIEKILGKGYTVESCSGHVRDLPTKEFGVDIDAGFKPSYSVIRGKGSVLKKLREVSKGAETVYLAPDPDREGEAIAWHLAQALKLPQKKIRRVTFNEITPSAIKNAFKSPGNIDLNKVDAQQTRRILDRIVGYQLSPLLWKKLYRGLSAGRVQSVALRLVVEREREIRNFKPREYWTILGRFTTEDGQQFEAPLAELDGEKIDLKTSDEAQAAVSRTSDAQFTITGLQRKQKHESPPPPHITSTLQQAASSALNFSTRRTMALAQQLYEGINVGEEGPVGLITYMRTDSFRVSADALNEVRAHIKDTFGEPFLPEKPNFFKSRKGAQEAHEAIRPTSVHRTPESIKNHLPNDLLKLYTLIWKRFVASQMAAAVYNITDVEITGGPALFKVQGRTVKFLGFRRLTPHNQEDTLLPPLSQGQQLDLLELKPEQHFTRPPNRYSEATLVRALERFGVGRPSTYSPTVSTIQERGYVVRRGRQLYANRLGEVVSDKLMAHFPEIMDIEFTSHMEEELDGIEEGTQDRTEVLNEFYTPFSKDLQSADAEMTDEADTCDLCGSPMTPRKSKQYGWFLSCKRYPDCKGTKAFNVPVLETSDKACEKCGRPMVVKTGKHGPFLACSGYPECKNTQPLEGEEPQQTQTNAVCEKCGKPMVIKRSRHGPFLACSGYPECKNTKPIGGSRGGGKSKAKCDKCGKPMVIKRSRHGPFLACSGYPECKNTKPLRRRKSPAKKST